MNQSASEIDVLFVVPSRNSKGGIGRLALYLSREFQNGHDIRLHILPTRWSERPILKHLTTLPALVSFTGRCAISRRSIVHINVATRGSTWRKFLFWLGARVCGAKTVLHLHGGGYDQFFRRQNGALRRLIRNLFSGVDHVIVMGKPWNDLVASEIGVDPERVSVIYNGVPEPNRTSEAKWKPPLLAIMGLVGEGKGTDVLIDALAGLQSLEWRAVVGGNGAIGKFQLLANAAGIGERIDFLGWVDEEDVDLWLKRASIFVLPSRRENQPLSILEAMARGLPVIATSVGTIPEQVIHGETGLLVPPGEVEPLRAAIEKLLSLPDQREAMGAAARRRYEKHFSIAGCAESLQSIYRSLAEQGPSEAASTNR